MGRRVEATLSEDGAACTSSWVRRTPWEETPESRRNASLSDLFNQGLSCALLFSDTNSKSEPQLQDIIVWGQVLTGSIVGGCQAQICAHHRLVCCEPGSAGGQGPQASKVPCVGG